MLVNRKNTRAWRDELRLFAQLVFNQCEKIKGLAPQRAEIVNGADQIQEGLELLNAEWDQLTVKKAWLVSQALIHGKKQILLARRQLRD